VGLRTSLIYLRIAEGGGGGCKRGNKLSGVVKYMEFLD
jgi:hypothetical protein